MMRIFRKTINVALLALLSFSFARGQEVGLQLYSLRNQFKSDVEGTLKTIHDWGISRIEGGDTYGMNPEAFRKLLNTYELDVVSIMVSFEELADDADGVVKKARDYGAKYVMCAWIPHKGDDFTIEDTQRAVDVFNRAGEILGREGLVLAYHPHGYEFRPYGDGTLFDYMAEHAEDFYFELDVYWARHGGADPLALLNKYADQFVMLHLKDMEKGVEGNTTGHEDVETNVVLGTGQINISAIVARAGELGIQYMFIEDESSRVLEQVPLSLAYLRGMAKQ